MLCVWYVNLLLQACFMKYRYQMQKSACFSGSTERRFLDNIEEIVARSLPEENIRTFFKDKDVIETYLLNQITFCEEMVQVSLQNTMGVLFKGSMDQFFIAI